MNILIPWTMDMAFKWRFSSFKFMIIIGYSLLVNMTIL